MNKVDYKSMIRISIPINWDSENEYDINDNNDFKEKERCIYCYKILLPSVTQASHELVCLEAKRCTLPRVICKNGIEKFICEYCYKTFKYLKSLIEHELKHEQPGGFVCKTCLEKFCSEIELKCHEEVAHAISLTFKIFQCSDCCRKLKSQEILNFHKNELNCGNIKPYPCSKCEKTFRTKYLLKSHELSIHIKGEEFCCTYCGEKFTSKGAIIRHERQHTGEKPYICNVCGKCFAHRESWVTHSSIHTGIKPYFCECCGLRFSCTSNLIAHRRKRPETCGLPQYCKKLSKISSHRQLKDPIVVKKKFKKLVNNSKNNLEEAIPNVNIDELIANQTILTPDKKYFCFDCKKIFHFKTSFVRHQKNIHKRTKEEIFEIVHPPEVREQISETGKPIYKCKYCKKSYTSPLYLSNHIKLHGDGTLIYGCRSCPKHFRSKSERNSHTTKKHNYTKKHFKRSQKYESDVATSESEVNNIESAANDLYELEKPVKIESLETYDEASQSLYASQELNSNETNRSSSRIKLKKNYNEDSNDIVKHIHSVDETTIHKSVKVKVEQSDLIEQPLAIKEENMESLEWNNQDNYKNFEYLGNFLEIKYNENIDLEQEEENIEFPCKSDYFCKLCKKHYANMSQFKQHLKCHDKNKRVEDTNDPLDEMKTRKLSKHIKNLALSTDENIFLCLDCNKKYYLKQSFLRHQKNSHNRSKTEIKKIMHLGKFDTSGFLKPKYFCKICNKKYSYMKFYESHMKNHENDDFVESSLSCVKSNKTVCDICEEQFDSLDLLKAHKKRFHDRTKSVENTEDNSKFNEINYSPEEEDSKNSSTFEEEDIFEIDKSQEGETCSENVFVENPYNPSILTGDKKKFYCPECKSEFGLKQSFVRHQKNIHKRTKTEIYKIMHPQKFREYTDKPKYKCKFCKRKYTYLKGLESHIKAHGADGSLIHQCQTCLKWFACKEEVKAHTVKDHKDEVTCILCNKMYTNSELLQTHIRYAHSEDPAKKPKKQIFCCGKCGKTMTSKTLLNNHEASDCGKNPIYKCPICGTCLNSNGSLKSHLQRHAGVKEFKCEFCGKEFATKSEHKVHQRIHTGEKPYQCTFCEKAFAYRENLLIHLSTHTGMKRYLCNACGERFSCVSGIKAHWRTHGDTCGIHESAKKAKATFFVGYRNGELKYTKE